MVEQSIYIQTRVLRTQHTRIIGILYNQLLKNKVKQSVEGYVQHAVEQQLMTDETTLKA